MINLNLFLMGLIIACGNLGVADDQKIINCFYDTFKQFPINKVVDNMDPNLCTHISYNFYDIDTESGEIKVSASMLTRNQTLHDVERIALLQKKNPNLKIMFVVGDGAKADRIAADPTLRKNFIESAMEVIENYNIDGLNLDWGDLPRLRNPANKTALVTLLAETYETMKSMGKQLDVTLFAEKKSDAVVYDIPGIAANVDFVNIKTFNFNIRESSLLDISKRLKTLGNNYLKSNIKYWIDEDIPASKLVLSLSFYEHVFNLIDPKHLVTNLQDVGNLLNGPLGGDIGWRSYIYICHSNTLYTNKWSRVYNVSYLIKGTEFIFYDNAESLGLKADLVNSLDLAGVMVWSIEADDFVGICGDGRFPLLNAIRKTIRDPPNSPSG